MLQQDPLLQTATLLRIIWIRWSFLSLWVWLTKTKFFHHLTIREWGFLCILVCILHLMGENMWNIQYGRCAYTLNVKRQHLIYLVTFKFQPSVTLRGDLLWLFFSHPLHPLVLCPRTFNLMASFLPKVFIPWPLTCLFLHLFTHPCVPTLYYPSLLTQAPTPCQASD